MRRNVTRLSDSRRTHMLPSDMPTADRRAPFVLAVAVLGISCAEPLIRLSAAAPLAIATWRVGFAMAVVGLVLVVSGGWHQWRTLTRQEFGLSIAAGVSLAVHFWSWNASLEYTSMAASVLLVNLQPVVVAAISARWLGEPRAGRQWAGIAIATTGAVVVALTGAGESVAGLGSWRRGMFGDTLALEGGVTVALYDPAGRRLRQRLDLWPYVGLVYGACLVSLVVLSFVARVPLTPQPLRELAIFAALAAGPVLLGHTGMNWALKSLPAYVVNLTVLGEPVGATVLAALLPWIHAVPGAATLAGGAMARSGVLVTARRARAGGAHRGLA